MVFHCLESIRDIYKISMKNISSVIFSLLLLLSCAGDRNKTRSDSNDLYGGRISVSGDRFTDSSGRQVILNGINFVNKNPCTNYMFEDSSAAFSQFRKLGFNCIRLGVIWDGVEPEPGIYDENYLERIESLVSEAGKEGLYVILDMHQDLYGRAYSDGAPEWATLTDGLPHATGSVWSDSYFISPAVQRAFDNFWANKPASDGKGVQDHYAEMWRYVAEKFSQNTTVIGYDIMNEPFNGSQGSMILPVILKAFATLYAQETGKVYTEEELFRIWGDEESRLEALNWMSDVDRYSRVISSAAELNQYFEKGHLASMYQRVSEKIREVDTTHILFLEHAYFSNAGVQSGIEPVKNSKGEPDPLVAYAAHGYDLLVDTKHYGMSSNQRVEYIFGQIKKVSERINRPVIIGEWGAFSGNSEEITSLARSLMGIFDSHLFSQTYWAYYKGIENDLYFMKTFSRPFPRYINGTLKEIKFQYETGTFSSSWEESPVSHKGTVFFVPVLRNLLNETIRLNPEYRNIIIQSIEGSEGGFLIIPATGRKETGSITFSVRQETKPIPLVKERNEAEAIGKDSLKK